MMRRTSILRPRQPAAPSLANLERYRASSTQWSNIPYGSASWSEPTMGGQVLSQVLDVTLPSTAAPSAGYPVILWFHANNATKQISGTPLIEAATAALAAGFAFAPVEFRHPVVNVNEGAPHNDVGRAIQFARGLANALNLDVNNVFALARSRGSLCLWQALQADMKRSGAANWAGRQSSLLKGIWAFDAQTTYSTAQIANLYVQSADQADFLNNNPDDARWGSAINSAAAAAVRPQLALVNEYQYYGTPQSRATDEGNAHYPDMQMSLRDAYIAAGDRAKVADMDLHPNTEPYSPAIDWFTAVYGGASAMEAMAIALAKASSGLLVYTPPDRTGVYTDTAGTTPANVNDAVANATNHGSGAAATQSVAADCPLLVAQGSGYALNFVDGSDVLATSKGTATTGTVVAAGQTGSTTPPASLIGNAPNVGGTPGISLRAQSATSVRLTLYDAAGSTAASPTVADASQPHVLEGWWTTTSMSCAVDGAAATTTAHARNPTSATGLGLGRQTAGATGQPWKGPGVLWFECDPVLSDSKRRAIARFAALLQESIYPS